jgi:hypothetical protein
VRIVRCRTLLALALLCGVLSLFVSARGGEGSSCAGCDSLPPEPARSVQAESAESQLAQKHAPIVYIKDQREACDTRGSPYVPVRVDFVLDVDEIVAIDGKLILVTSEPAKFAEAACARGGKCLYFAFEESVSQIMRNLRSIGIDLGKYEQDGLLRIHAAGRNTGQAPI